MKKTNHKLVGIPFDAEKQTDQLPRKHQIGTRLFLVGAILVILSGLIVAIVGATIARQGVLAESERRVLSLVEQRESHLRDWLDAYINTARQLVIALSSTHIGIDADHYKVLYTLPGVMEAALLNEQGDQISGLHSLNWKPDSVLVNKSVMFRQTAIGPIRMSESGDAVFELAVPITSSEGHTSSSLILRIDSKKVIDPIMTDTSGLGQRGELFLLDRDMRMLTPSRFHSHPDPLSHIMDIPPAQAAFQTYSGSMQYTSFLGEPVVGAYVNMLDYEWILVGELDVREALNHVRSIYERTAFVLVISLLALLGVTLVLARSWARPIVRLTGASREVAEGNYEVFVTPPRQKDELHSLTISFNRMTGALQTGRKMLAHAQRSLVQQETMAAIGGLVTSIVHEMRNPLSSIKMNLRLLERYSASDDPSAEHISLASQEAGRLEGMLGELLDYGKPVDLKIEPVSLNEFVQSVGVDLNDLVKEQKLEFTIVTVNPPPVALVDRELLRRTIENLLRNACEATDQGGTINLSILEESTGKVGFVLTDSGHGMKESVIKRVFNPFFTTRDEGTGLGMSNVKKFVDVMKGDLHIESLENVGTKVTVILPGDTD